jgi:hypothetical protein
MAAKRKRAAARQAPLQLMPPMRPEPLTPPPAHLLLMRAEAGQLAARLARTLAHSPDPADHQLLSAIQNWQDGTLT